MSEERFTLVARVKSVRYALSGIGFMVRTQRNVWLHLAATIVVVATGLFLDVSGADWRWLVTAIILVWVAEAMNTALSISAMSFRRSFISQSRSPRMSPRAPY